MRAGLSLLVRGVDRGLLVLAGLGLVGVAGATAAVPAAQQTPDLRCPSALCRTDDATRQLSDDYRACMTREIGISYRAARRCVRIEQKRQNKALGVVEAIEDARSPGGYAEERRLFHTEKRSVCHAIALERTGAASRWAFETCVLHKTAARVVRWRRSLLP